MITIAAPGMAPVTARSGGRETLARGLGGWETLERPRNAPAADWVGTPETTLELPLVLSGIDANGPGRDRSIEADLNALIAFGQPLPKTKRPPILQVRGLASVAPSERWVLQSLEVGDYLTGRGNTRIQVEVTLSLLAYRAPQLVRGPAAKARASRQGKGKDAGKGSGKGSKRGKP